MATPDAFLPPGFDTPPHYIEALISFIDQYRWLYEVHVVDIFPYQQWELLDPSWREALVADSDNDAWFETIIALPSFNRKVNPEWPESLKEFIHTTQSIALPRFSSTKSKGDTKCDKNLLFGMTNKKIHEVELMSSLIHRVAKERGINHVLDMGSGQGYLSRALAFQHDMEVLAVDKSEVQTRGAEKFDRRTMRAERTTETKLQHVTEMITPENISDVLSRWGRCDDDKPWLICGLHTCGDLSPMIMRLFEESKQVTCLVNVGCCYHYLSEGFPMSRLLREREYELGTTARVLACHSPWQWKSQVGASKKSFEQHFFRALLQQMMVDKGLASRSDPPALRKRITKKCDFATYVKIALKTLDMDPDAITPEEIDSYYHDYKYKRAADKQIIALWTIRSLLAPVLESLILMDRWLYLKEAVGEDRNDEHSGVWMWPLFDPTESPRNVVFVASK